MAASSDQYSIAFATFRNMNLGMAHNFENRGITPEMFFSLPLPELCRLSGVSIKALRDDDRKKALADAGEELNFMESHNIKAVLWNSPEYPERLARCEDAPAVLFIAGNTRLSFSHVVSIVGTRRCSAYGADMCRQLVADLHNSIDDLLIVSGLAYGVDIAAHRAALDAGVPTGAILAHGLRTLYPAEHRLDARNIIRSGGFLATEYTSSSPIHRGQFLARNRIVAGLADAVIVVESDIKGGAMATARIANAYSREVFALPGRVTDRYSRGTNELIFRNEASIIRDAADIINCCGWTPKPAEGTQQTLSFELSDEQLQIVNAIRQHPDYTVNQLSVSLSIPISHLSALLFEMEMDNIIVAIPGGRYTLINPDI